MLIPTLPLVLIVFSIILFALGQDPNKKHGNFAVGALAIAGVVYLLGVTPQTLAMLGQ